MSTTSEIKQREIESRENIADADRRQKERSDKRSAKASFYGNAIKSLGSMLGKINDEGWYTKLPGLTGVNTSIPDFEPIGVKDLMIRDNHDDVFYSVAVPSVFRVNYAPTIGFQKYRIVGNRVTSIPDGTDAANRALNRVCSELENRNSRVLSYSRDTVGRYLFIVTDMLSTLVNLKAALDIYTMADATKPFIARQLIRAKGFDYLDFKTNIAAYKDLYIALAAEMNTSVPIPADLTFLHRQLWLANTIVKDSKGKYSSYIVFYKALHFGFPTGTDPLSTERADSYIPFAASQPRSFIGFSSSMREQIDRLVNGATWKPLIRDIRGGIKNSAFFVLPTDLNKPSVTFTDVDEVRHQLMNMDIAPFVNVDIPSTTGTAQYKGMITEGFTIGGNAKEAVVQNALYGVRNTNDPLISEFLKQVTPGTMVFECSSQAAASALLTKFEALRPGTKYLINGLFSQDSIYAIPADEKHSYLVGTRLKAKYTVRTVHLESGASGGVVLHTDSGNAIYNIAANTDKYVVFLQPVVYGSELILSMDAMRDQPDDVSVVYAPWSATSYNWFSAIGQDSTVAARLSNTILMHDLSVRSDSQIQLLDLIGYFSTIDWHPIVQYWGNDTKEGNRNIITIAELDHYTHIDGTSLYKLNDQCLESEFSLNADIYIGPLKGN